MALDVLGDMLELYKRDKIEHPEKYVSVAKTLEPCYDPSNNPKSPFYEGAHDVPMRPARKINLVQLSSLGMDINFYTARRPQL